jgi:autotransporter-associated beta strand protein
MLNQILKKVLRATCILVVAGAFILTMAGPQHASAVTVVDFAPGVEASSTGLTPSQIAGLQTANFNTLVLFSITIETNGDFYYGGGGGPNILLCTNGAYAGPTNWGSLLSQCEASPSTINRIEMCIGGYLDQSFLNIKTLITANGTGTNTVLYQNLSALKNALSLNAMDYDDEYEYDSPSAVEFGQMCGALGMNVTLCPYTNPGYWQQVVSGLGSTVDYVYLQCYAGGQGQDPATWSGYFGGSVPVLPGDWDSAGEIGFLDQMQVGVKEGCIGGWYWPSADNGTVSISTLTEYISLIHVAFGPNIDWQGGTADYNVGANWVGSAVPGTGANAINDSGSNNIVQINATDPVWTLNDLWAGNGSSATGAFVQNGSTVNVGSAGGLFRLGVSSGAAGYYTINAGALNITNNCDVGETGTGVLTINGGVINIGSAGTFDISDTGTEGTVTQTNGTVNCSAQTWVGQNTGTGTYNMSGTAALNCNNWIAIGRDGGTGVLNLSGGTITKTDGNGDHIDIGASGHGTLTQTGGLITNTTSDFWVGESSNATWNFNGGSALLANVIICVDSGATGTLNINGGVFRALSITTDSAGTSTSTINLNGGTVQAASNNTNFINHLSAANVQAGGAIFDSQGYSITIPQALVAGTGSGGLIKLGIGTLTLAATNTYTGTTVVSNGTVALKGFGQLSQSSLISLMAGTVLNVNGRSDQTLTLNSGQTLTESGSVDGKLNALAGSTISPGAGIATLTVQNNITLAGQLTMELNRTNVQNCNELVSSEGSITGGGVLTVNNLGAALQWGDTFQLFNNPVSGFVTINLPVVSPYSWANNLASNGTIAVTVSSTIPTNITAQVTGDNLVLTWPSDHTGWQLQCQTNALIATNWSNVTGSTATNQVAIPINLSNNSLFFRLIYNP